MPKKLNPYEVVARRADEYIDAWERQDGSKRQENVLTGRRDRLLATLLNTIPEVADDDAATPPATVAAAP